MPQKNIGSQVIILSDQSRIILSVYSNDEKSGYIIRNGKQVAVKRVGYVDDRRLKHLWQVK